MKRILCKIRRKAGSSVMLGETTYRWNDANGHVCDNVEDAHAAVLLAVPEAFIEAPEAPASANQFTHDAADQTAEEKPERKKPGRKPKAVPTAIEPAASSDDEAAE